LATRVFEIGDGRVEVYPGNYEDYLWRKQGGNIKQNEAIRQQLQDALYDMLAHRRSIWFG